MTIDQFVSWLVSSEWDDRRNRAVERAIKSASFRYKANVEEIDFSIERGMGRNQILRLAELGFIKEHKDLFITGSTGTGKSYLATRRLSALTCLYWTTSAYSLLTYRQEGCYWTS